MKKAIATVIAGLFATAAFAQTPAPATSKPAAKQAVLVNNTDLKASKADTKTVHAEAPTAQAATTVNATHEDAMPAAMPAHAKTVKTSAKHAKSKTKHVAKADTVKDSQDTAGASSAPAAPLGQDAAPAPTPVDSAVPAATTAPAPVAAPVPATTPAPAAPVSQ